MRPSILTFFSALVIAFSASSQISSFNSATGTTCSYSADGTITFSGVEGCFAPITAVFDSTTYVFETLKNDGYEYIHHGAGTGDDYADDVWAGASSLGNVHIATGSFQDSVTFDTVTIYGTGTGMNMFLVCFDSTNEVLWATSAGTTTSSHTEGYGVTGDGTSVYVTGYFSGTSNFQSQSLTSGNIQTYIAKYNISTGTIDTVIQIGGSGEEYGFDIYYANDRVYLTGSFTGSINLAGSTFNSIGSTDVFVTCYNTTLTDNPWAATGGGASADLPAELVAGQNNGVTERVFVTGVFHTNATFGSQNMMSNGGIDAFVAAIDTNGTWLWAQGGGGLSNFDGGGGIAVNSTGDEIYVAGLIAGTGSFSSQAFVTTGPTDGFIATLDSAGTLTNFYQFDGGQSERLFSVKCIDDGYLIFSGQIQTSITYADSTFTTSNSVDAFVGKIGPNNHEIWGKAFGGTGNDDVLYSVELAAGGKFHTAGYFVLDASAYQSGLISAGSYDAIVTTETVMGTADTSVTVTGLTGGEYYIVLTDSNGNSITDTVLVPSPDPIVINGTVTNASSGSSNDGAIDITVTGGTPGYTYAWSSGPITEDLSGLSAGTYTVTVTDTLGCLDSATFVVDTGFTPIAVISVVTGLDCFGDSSGTIDLTVTGGVPPLSFAWSNGAITEDLLGIPGGTYTVTITDSDTSSHVETFIVTEPAEIVITGTITTPSSGTSNDGAIDVSVTGGVPGYSYLWSNGAITEDLSNLVIGFYTITVTDSTGCYNIETFHVDTIPALSIVLSASDVTCINTDNGMIDLTVIGGVSPFSFNWSNGANTEDVTGLSTGVYSVTVTDNAGQVVSDAATVGSNPIYPDPVVGPITGAGSAQAWTLFNYSVPSTSGSSFNWSAGGGSVINSVSNTAVVQWDAGPQGVVYVSETDVHGCYAEDSLQVNIIFVGIDETGKTGILLYPNPVKDVLNIAIPEVFSNPQLHIHDMQGKLVYTARLGTLYETIDLGTVVSGTYILTLFNEELSIKHRIVVQ